MFGAAVLPAAPRQGAGGPVALRQGVGRDAVPGLLLITCEVESSRWYLTGVYGKHLFDFVLMHKRKNILLFYYLKD